MDLRDGDLRARVGALALHLTMVAQRRMESWEEGLP